MFISYSHKDEKWVVHTLLPALENAGLKVCIDYRDFDAGKPSIVNMEDAVDESRHTVLVLTPNWTGGEWTDFEAVLTQTDDPVGRRQKMIPIMLEKCDPPKRVKALTYVDFMRSDRLDNAWKQLFKALGKPDAPIQGSSTSTQAGSRDTWNLAHPYPMPPNFTGRKTELEMLDTWLADNKDRLFILRALGGFGKSALAWQWINTHVNPAEWRELVFWSFYEGDASFEHFIEETLKYLNLEVSQSKREQVDALLKAMQTQKVLLILDGFERLLRAYSGMNAAYQGDQAAASPSPTGRGVRGEGENNQRDCVNLDAEHFIKSLCSMPGLKSRALMTTRLSPRALEQFGQFIQGCREKELKAMEKEDATAFLRAQGVQKGTNHEIEEVCRLYGFHPLSLRLLAGHIMSDLKNAGDILVAQKLKVGGDIASRQNHILEVSYNGIAPRRQKLLSTIACLRSSTKLETLESIAGNKETLDDDLHDLIERGLLQFDRQNSIFDLHPIVRRYAYDRFTAPERKEAHIVLVVYFEAVPKPPKVEKLEDLAPVIELYHHMVGAGKLDEATDLYYDRMYKPIYFQFGAYHIEIELLRALFLDGEDKPPRLKKESDQAWTLNELANAYSLGGQPRRAVLLFEMHNAIYEKAGVKKNLAIGLGNVAQQQLVIGALRAAERNLRRNIELSREVGNEMQEGYGNFLLAYIFSLQGVWNNAEQELNTAQGIFEKIKHTQGLGWTYSYRALRFLLMAREAVASNQLSVDRVKSAIECAQRALELADETTRTLMNVPRDYVSAYWLLGAAYCASVVSIRRRWSSTKVSRPAADPSINSAQRSTTELESLTLAEENLSKALNLCRQINLVESEADILLDLARLRRSFAIAQDDMRSMEEARSLAGEALLITERCGYVLQGADVNLFLAELALTPSSGHPSPAGRGDGGEGEQEGKALARKYAETALKLATCEGPPYYYKVAYEEAERFLANLAA